MRTRKTRDEFIVQELILVMKNILNRNDIAADTLSAYGSYTADDGETIRTQLAETKNGQHAVRAYAPDSGTEIYVGPFATQAEAEEAADAMDWQGARNIAVLIAMDALETKP